MNIGGIFSTGPVEAAWVINELVKPNSVIASHVNSHPTVTPFSRPIVTPYGRAGVGLSA
jgi:hypothetical protein